MRAEDLLSAEAAFLQLELVAGRRGLPHRITSHRVQKPGLALAGFLQSIRPGRVQILGASEITFLSRLPAKRRIVSIRGFCRAPVAAVIVTKGLEVPAALREAADRAGIPLFRSPVVSSRLIEGVQQFLEDRLSQRIQIHAGLVDLFGLGVLILGDSGVGKSELALELVARGHRLVADDVVEIHRHGDTLTGSAPDLARYHMELRGIGIINIKDLFGVAAVRLRKDVELVVQLDPWQEGKAYDRLGLDEKRYQVLGMVLPFIEMPVAPGRNLAILLEVAARNELLKRKGYHPARDIALKVERHLGGRRR
ncbi:MAG: HPr(Ser) kinase/phosphatase [Acidobacteria bacterium]|nr:HPr(Ser) kinase/phosphatase [Acidobacteriota bacterium]